MANSENRYEESPPPIFGTWNRMYAFVLLFHFILIMVLYWFTVAFQ